MKKIVLVLGAIILVALFFWRYHERARPEAGLPASNGVSGGSTQAKETAPAPATAARSSEEKSRDYVTKAREAGKGFNRPGQFYGRIVDQNGEPVVGVTIKIGLSYFSDVVLADLRPHYREFDRVSNDEGIFVIDGVEGLSLDLRLQPKPGYEFKPAGLGVTLRDIGAGIPAPTLSTASEPYVFRAFRQGRSERLVKGQIAYYEAVPDGRFYVVNLKEGRIAPTGFLGDFKISVERPLGWTDQTDYNWGVKIEAMGMELIEAPDDVFMYEAPAAGYVSAWSFSALAGEPRYSKEAVFKFYLKARDGSSYGRVELTIKSNSRDKSAALIYYWLNPAGSRNLAP